MWQSVVDSQSTMCRRQKAEAAGFLATWSEASFQLWLTSLIGDIAYIFCNLQKKCQKGTLILPDVMTCCDQALRKLQLMKNIPFLEGLESKVVPLTSRLMSLINCNPDKNPTYLSPLIGDWRTDWQTSRLSIAVVCISCIRCRLKADSIIWDIPIWYTMYLLSATYVFSLWCWYHRMLRVSCNSRISAGHMQPT